MKFIPEDINEQIEINHEITPCSSYPVFKPLFQYLNSFTPNPNRAALPESKNVKYSANPEVNNLNGSRCNKPESVCTQITMPI